MKNKSYILILATAIMLMIMSCDREIVAPPEPVINHISVSQLRDMYLSGVTTVDTSVYIQGVVVLTPEMKNTQDFMAYVMDSTGGICITVSDADNTLVMDSEVKILCNGVSFLEYNGLLQFGDNESLSIAEQIEIVSLTATIDPDTVTIAQLLTGDYESRYVYIPGVQFAESGTFSGSQVLTDCTSEISVYTDPDATFSGAAMPTGNGYLKGVSSQYNSQQILLRDVTELDMAGERCGSVALTFLSQDFNSIVRYADVSTLTGWLTYAQAGGKTWYGNKKYDTSPDSWVQASGYNSGQPSVISWMITPVLDFTDATSPYIIFESANGYDKGATLKLYASTDYDGSETPWTFTWTELSFTLPPLNGSGWSDFISSGKVDLSGYAGGTVYIAWVYTGSSTLSTTWEVDNVLVAQD